MQRLIRVGIIGVLGAMVLGAKAQVFTVSYEQTVTHGRDVIQSKVLIKDDLFRIESAMAGLESVIIRNAEGVFHYLPKDRMAMKMPMIEEPQEPATHLNNYAGYLKERHAELLRSEVVNGVTCDVYRFTDPAIQGSTTAWVWKEKQFPVRLEIDGADGKTLVELRNIQVGAAAPDDAFQLPSRVQVMDTEQMPALKNLLSGEGR